MKRSLLEKLFIFFFIPGIFLLYSIKSYPDQALQIMGIDNADASYFFLASKSPNFWYQTLYTLIIVSICLKLLLTGKSPYGAKPGRSELSGYQKKKFTCIMLVQGIGFYFVPFVLPMFNNGWADSVSTSAHKYAHVYVSPAFLSWGAFIYMFVIIPIFVWFFGKRYCSWICACGNLAETVGTTKWGSKWVKEGTPRGENSHGMEFIQVAMLLFSLMVGVSAVLNVKGMIDPTTYHRLWYLQDFLTDFIFGSLIGVGLYPFYGTRMWCRYGCPMARWMKIFGRFSKSKFAVVPNDKCRGIGLCTQACPMGIPVADYAHKDKKPIEVSFGLEATACIGCGGCIDSCPVDALSFQLLGGKTVISTKKRGALPELIEVEVMAINDLSPTIKNFVLKPKEFITYKAGQFLTFHVGEESKISRCYSLNTSPSQPGNYEVSVKKLEDGQGSGWMHDKVKVGDTLKVSPPSGKFTLKQGTESSIFVAGGIGITPMISMVKYLLETGSKKQLYLFYAAQGQGELVFHKELLGLSSSKDNFHYTPMINAAEDGWQGATGYLSEEMMRSTGLSFKKCDLYTCGPPPMMDSAKNIAVSAGMPEDKFHNEVFASPSSAIIEKRRAKIQLNKSGKTLEYNNNIPLLEFFEENNVDVPSSCHAGVCGTCEVTITQGKIETLESDYLTEEEKKEGRCLTCISFPEGNIEIDL